MFFGYNFKIFGNNSHKPEGRRWSFKEEVMSLSILKRGPMPAPFIGHSLFPLPSWQTLQTVLNTALGCSCIQCTQMHSTVNIWWRLHMLSHVWCNISQRELATQSEFGSIEGFEELGSHGRIRCIANQIPVFMLCGLRKKWRQQLTCCVIHGSTKGEVLVNSLMPVKVQYLKLLPPCVVWVATVSRPWNIWAFLRRHLSSCCNIVCNVHCLMNIFVEQTLPALNVFFTNNRFPKCFCTPHVTSSGSFYSYHNTVK